VEVSQDVSRHQRPSVSGRENVVEVGWFSSASYAVSTIWATGYGLPVSFYTSIC
jgi:hypothetical protein